MCVLKWLVLWPVNILADLVVIIFAPLAALLSMGKPSLPSYLMWMQTHDNSIDTLYQQPHHLKGYPWLKDKKPEDFEKSNWLRWQARTLWLIRNPAYGLANMFGYESGGEEPKVIAQKGKWDSDSTNWLILKWKGAFQVRAQIFYPFAKGYFLRIYIGWKSTDGKPRLMFAGHVNPFRKWKVR